MTDQAGVRKAAGEKEAGKKAIRAVGQDHAPVGQDHQRSRSEQGAGRGIRGGGAAAKAAAAMAAARRSGNHNETPQRSNDRRDTDHGGRTPIFKAPDGRWRRRRSPERRKAAADLKEMAGGWGLKLGFVAECGKYVRSL
ncbi:hypothetical protein Scep_010469 [Stephania cephalantha]|uniref:Uncharacterized protein n=1 Tax=Stephania cephalantha TaxID=152367 RepID=A0AAP0JV40_9MAGN